MHIFSEFIHSLDLIQKNSPDIYNKIIFDFYGSVPQNFNKIISNHKNIIKYHGFVSLFEANIAIGNSSATLLFLTDDMTYSFSTKFYEYLAQKKPILLFSKKGQAGKFISENKLGFSIEYGNTYNHFISALYKIENGFEINKDFDISVFDVENLTKKYIQIITNA